MSYLRNKIYHTMMCKNDYGNYNYIYKSYYGYLHFLEKDKTKFNLKVLPCYK